MQRVRLPRHQTASQHAAHARLPPAWAAWRGRPLGHQTAGGSENEGEGEYEGGRGGEGETDTQQLSCPFFVA